MKIKIKGEDVEGRLGLVNWYRSQLKKFEKIGMGKETEFGVVISDVLINATKRRMLELKYMKRGTNASSY
tara:strand:+ start:273 stop:482 length:210 start_codon:yes stop_codon:yes gene_type:complete